MFRIFGRKQNATFYPQCSFKKRVDMNFDLQVVSQVLRRKFPFLNLLGLAELKGLSVHVASERVNSRTEHSFFVFHGRARRSRSLNIVLKQELKKRETLLTEFYPELPGGKHLGLTLFFLILTRGNHFAKHVVEVEIPLRPIQGMVDKMTGFKVATDKDEEARQLTVPELSAEEVAAVEWFWVNILKCPIL